MGKQRAIVLGIHSFLDQAVKVSSQYIAEGLADLGWLVDYISMPSSPFDLYGRERRKRFVRVWLRSQDKNGIQIKPGLTEYAFRTLHPARKLFLRNRRLLNRYSCLAPRWLGHRHYDICIHDITTNVLFVPLVHSNLLVLRLNDSPEGFSSALHPILINHFKQLISAQMFHDTWAVSSSLARYSLDLNPKNRVVVIPNGVENSFRTATLSNPRRAPKTAIYLGSISPWVDMELLEQTALLMPDWEFHIIGPCERSWIRRAANLKQFAPVKRSAVPELLSQYQVGLIPFRETTNLTEHIERPLKFYEYIASGLGIASTDVGNLKAGMGNMAVYGNTPADFAIAIKRASREGAKRPLSFNHEFIQRHSWKNILQKMCTRISALQSRMQ